MREAYEAPKAAHVSATLEPRHRAQLERIAQAEDRTLSYLVRQAVSEYLARTVKP
jgi:predicted transcriptional regulator